MSFNFALILFWLMVGTGIVWFADRLIFKRKAADPCESRASRRPRDLDSEPFGIRDR